MSVLISMGAWLLFGTPGGGEGVEPAPQQAADWQLVPGADADEPRCSYDGNWAALEYWGPAPDRVGEDLSVRPGERWEFEDGWEAENTLWAIAGDPLPGSPQEELTEVELAEYLQSAPSNWSHGERTACVAASGPPQGPAR